jgi:tricorn protease
MRRVRPSAPVLALCALIGACLASPVPAAAEGQPAAPARGLRFPALTPDGKTVVFSWRGDLWRAPVAGGRALRLTIHEALDTKPRVSPDGKRIAFTSKRTGNLEVFVVSIDGGEPRQVTFHSAMDVATDWSPDGAKILFFSGREPSGTGTEVFEVDAKGGTARRLTRDGGRDGAYSPDGKSIVYARGWNLPFQDEYRGSANFDLWVQDLAGGPPRPVTKTARNEMNPGWAADGKSVWYLAEDQEGVFGACAVGCDGSEARRVTAWSDGDVRRATLGWDRRTLAFERDARLYTVDLLAPEPKATPIDVTIETDVRNAGSETRTITDGPEHVSVSPDGTQVAAAVRGDLWVLPAAGGEGTRITSGPATDDWPRWSPDGKRLLFFSDENGNQDVWTVDLATKERKAVVSSPKDDAFPSWAPDGRRIVYTSERTGNKDLFVLDLESGEERQLTHDGKDDDDAVFSADGKWIAFDSGRGGSQAIWVVPAAGPESAARRVTSGSGFFQCPSFSPDGTMIAFEEVDTGSGGSGGVYAVKTSGGDRVQLSRDGQTACWSPRGDWIYFTAERQGSKELWRVRAPQSIEGGEKVPFLGRVTVERRKEYGDLFDEAWKKIKDGFYDEKLHGVDWDAMKARYRPLAEDAEVKEELHNVISQMLGELKASHLGIFGGDDDDDAAPRERKGTGYLGVEWEAAVPEGGGRKVASVVPKGPADEAGIRAGDVVTSIGGQEIAADSDLDRLLEGTAGTEVAVARRKADGSGDATVKVKAAGWNALNGMRRARWVAASRKTVESRSKSTLGYVHLDQMNQPNLQRFQEALGKLNQDRRVRGLVLDVRNNGGGNIHQQLLQALVAKPYAQVQARGGPKQTQPAVHWGKPVVLLVNERSFSDAEVFPYGFKALGLGKVVGVPTAGGVIGTVDVTLSDGSRFRIPRVGYYGMDGTNLEHLGVAPDVVVEETAEDRLAGRDPQLEKAVDVLLAEIGPVPEGPADVVNPLFDAKVGEWVRVKVTLRGGEGEATVRVTNVTDDEVELTQEMRGPGGARVERMSHARREKRTKDLVWNDRYGTVEGKETLTVKGVPLECTIVALTTPQGQVEKRWISNAVPVGGTVRRETDGKVTSELLDWGSDGKP